MKTEMTIKTKMVKTMPTARAPPGTEGLLNTKQNENEIIYNTTNISINAVIPIACQKLISFQFVFGSKNFLSHLLLNTKL